MAYFFWISPLGRGIRMWSSWGFATAPGFQIIMSNFNHERWMITVVCIARARICTEEGGRLWWSTGNWTWSHKTIVERYKKIKPTNIVHFFGRSMTPWGPWILRVYLRWPSCNLQCTRFLDNDAPEKDKGDHVFRRIINPFLMETPQIQHMFSMWSIHLGPLIGDNKSE